MKRILKLLVLCGCIMIATAACDKVKNNQPQTGSEVVSNNQETSESNTSNVTENVLADGTIRGVRAHDDIIGVAQDMYYKVDIGMTKEELVDAIGEPSNITSIMEGFESYSYMKEINGKEYDVFNVVLQDETVATTSINVSFFEELIPDIIGTQIKDMNEFVGKFKEGMSLDEVEKILGKVYIEISKSGMGISYMWYDLNNASCQITTRDGKVFNAVILTDEAIYGIEGEKIERYTGSVGEVLYE